MDVTEVFNKTTKAFINPSKRLIVNYGGSSSSKTISILQLLLLYALKHPNKRVSVIGQTLPKVRRTVLKDFQKIVLVGAGLEHLEESFNKSELVYSLPSGSTIQFLSSDAESKVIGMRQDIAYFDEVNHIPQPIYDQICIRTSEKILVSYNPSGKFYLMDEFNREDIEVIHSTYKDNKFVSEAIIKELEEKGRRNENFRRVYLEGKLGVYEGLIFEEGKNYNFVNGVLDKTVVGTYYGMDFGFEHPTVLVELTLYDDDTVYIKELLYESKLTANDIVKRLNSIGFNKNAKILADSSRPEVIQTIYGAGYNIHPVKKTKVEEGVNKMLDYYMYVDSVSTHLRDELYNYIWAKDKNGNNLEIPIKMWDDAMDAIRYAQTQINKKRGRLAYGIV